MKKLLLLAAAAAGIAVVAKSRSDQLKASAAKVTSDPRVQSALATASEKAGPVASTVKDKAAPVVSQVGEKVSAAAEAASTFAHDHLHHDQDAGAPTSVDVPEVPPAAERLVEDSDPVSAPEFTQTEPPASIDNQRPTDPAEG